MARNGIEPPPPAFSELGSTKTKIVTQQRASVRRFGLSKARTKSSAGWETRMFDLSIRRATGFTPELGFNSDWQGSDSPSQAKFYHVTKSAPRLQHDWIRRVTDLAMKYKP
jgi:hypothetical protein